MSLVVILLTEGLWMTWAVRGSLRASTHFQRKSAKFLICPKGEKIETCVDENKYSFKEIKSATVIKTYRTSSGQPKVLKILTVSAETSQRY